jgi:NADH-quinone oxidoreductase subunit I
MLGKFLRVTHIPPMFVTFKHLFKKPVTVQYPEERLTLSGRYKGLHSLDPNLCIGCGICAKRCPNKTIELKVIGVEEKEIKEKIVKKEIKRPQIFMGRCMFCGLCVEGCPKGALTMTSNYELATYDRESLLYTHEQLAAQGEAPAAGGEE